MQDARVIQMAYEGDDELSNGNQKKKEEPTVLNIPIRGLDIQMAYEGDDELTNEKKRKMQESTASPVQKGQTYGQMLENASNHLTSTSVEMFQGVGGERQTMLGLLQAPYDLHSFRTFEDQTFNENQGMYGSMQGLLNSFSKLVPEKSIQGAHGVNMFSTISPGYGYGSGPRKDAALGYGSPARNTVDDSGYESSESSVYDVPSDDEDYNKNNEYIKSTGEASKAIEANESDEDSEDGGQNNEQDIEGQRVPDEDDTRSVHILRNCDGLEATNDNIGGSCSNVNQECPCMNGKPFLHVLAPGFEDDSSGGTQKKWKRRNRIKRSEDRKNCRISKGMGPVEIALRNAPYRTTKYIFEPILGLTFDSENEAYEFYNMYSWEAGFGIKRASRPKNNEKKYHTGRDFRCLCSGSGETSKYKTKKTNCKAMLRLLRTDDDGWFISEHIKEHNHALTETCGQTQEWFSHGRLDQCAMDMIKYLRENKVSLAKVQCIMGSMFGSMDKIPVTKRSLRAICSRIARDQMDDDIQKTLDAFRQIRQEDPDFQFSVEPGEDNEINSLLWINGKSREQYKCFGDVICFDTTYCTNIYKRPFGLFVGVNNHFQTTIFGGVFMKQETTDSFSWVFREFASLMGGVEPQTIFTDQCSAMAAALKITWEHSVHLLCKWHLFKDARSKFGAKYKKGSSFRKLFHKIVNDMMTVDEFERAWTYMLKEHKLIGNEYLENIYFKRKMWAKPFLKNIFCARIASTQRSESANHMLKRYVPRNCSMNRFIVQFNKLLFDRNREEDRAEFDTTIVEDVRERAWPIEEHARKLYTAAAYALFRKEVTRSTFYIARENIERNEFDIVHVKPHKKLPWGREKFTVKVNHDEGRYDCECGLYSHFGILCSHAIRILIQLGVYEIPKAYINKRWTRSARDILPQRTKAYQKETLCMQSMTFRHSFLYVNAVDVVHNGNKDLGAFDIASKYLKKAQRKLKEYFMAKEKKSSSAHHQRFRMKAAYYPSESDMADDSGSEREIRGNTFGASGSSAWMSDSELLKLKGPSIIRQPGRPKEVRHLGSSDYYGKKKKRKMWDGVDEMEESLGNGQTKNKKKITRCGECSILGHSTAQCKKKQVDVSTELPDF